MSTAASLQNLAAKPKALSNSSHAGLLLRRKCACGSPTSSLTGECTECKSRKRLQTKLAIGASNDPLEQEADRVADQVLAAPANPAVSGAIPHIQRFTDQPSAPTGTAPASVDRVLASLGRPLDPELQQDMEQRFGHDFSRVRVHSDVASGRSARHVNAHAYTAGYDIVFGAGRFAPATLEGRRLLAHELTHVIQQTGPGDGWAMNSTSTVQRDDSRSSRFEDPKDLVEMYSEKVLVARILDFDTIAYVLKLALSHHPSPYKYVVDVLKAAGSNDEDQLGAAFVKKLPEPTLDQIASKSSGRHMLNILYEAIITGDATQFEREQANRILAAKLRQKSPEHYVSGAMRRASGAPTPIFPIRFMRVTPGYDYATPILEVLPNDHLLVKYPNVMQSMSMFKAEMRTLGDVFGAGMDLNPNEIVGIRDYEKGGDVHYLPALALIDYWNQAIQSTSGKIIEVSLTVATLGVGGGAAAGRAVAKELITSTAIWAARGAKVVSVLDRAAAVIEIAAFVINENRDWIISNLGGPGRRLVQLSDIASSAAAIYGLARLGQGGYHIVKEMRAASKEARALSKQLTAEQSKTLTRLDDETDLMLKELDDEAAKSGRAAVPTPAEKPAVSGHVDDPAAAKAAAKGEVATADAGVKPTKTGGDAAVSAKYTTPDGEVIKITKDGEIWICTNPCDRFAQSYHGILEKNKDLASELENIRKIDDPKTKAEALGALKLKADGAPITELQGLATDGSYRFVVAGKAHRGNALRLSPDDWTHILEGHVKATFDASKRAASRVSTVFKGTPAQYLVILEEAVKSKAVIRELKMGKGGDIVLKVRNQEWILKVDLMEGAIKSFHARRPITNKHLFDVINVP